MHAAASWQADREQGRKIGVGRPGTVAPGSRSKGREQSRLGRVVQAGHQGTWKAGSRPYKLER